MGKVDKEVDTFGDLRQRAEKTLTRTQADDRKPADMDLSRLVQELEMHQVELQLQNEELRSARAELEESRDQYAELYEQAPVGYVNLDRQGLITRSNIAAREMLGLTARHHSNYPFYALVHPEYRKKFRLLMGRVARGLEPKASCEIRMAWNTKTGFPSIMQMEVAASVDARGKIRGWRIAFVDVTERKEMEERFRVMADSIPQLAWIAGGDGYISWYNQRWYDYTGTTSEQMEGWGWQSVHDPQVLPKVLEQWRESIATGKPFDMVFPLRGRDGSFRQFLTRILPMKDSEGRIVRWFGTNTDITDRMNMEEELRKSKDELELRVQERTAELETTMKKLEESNQALEHFAFTASHDLQEPLRKIQSFGNVLAEHHGAALNEQGKDYLERMVEATRRMSEMVESLLTYSRVSTRAEEFQRVDLASLAKDVVSDLGLAIEKSGGQVEVGKLCEVEADRIQMRQLIQNLIGNALKFHGGKAPMVHIWAEMEDGKEGRAPQCRIYVEDNGIGFDEKYLERIFGLFQRLHGRSEYIGAGIGLAICKKIVERHGGSITARSALGKGTIFIITLPAKQLASA